MTRTIGSIAGSPISTSRSLAIRQVALSNLGSDDLLRQRLARSVHAPAFIDAEAARVVRGLTITSKPNVRISVQRAGAMLTDDAKFAATPGHHADIHVYPD